MSERAHESPESIERASPVPRRERYADLRSPQRTSAAFDLTRKVYAAIERWETQSGTRTNKRRAVSRAKFEAALARFLGDLLLARVGEGATGTAWRPIGHDAFTDAPVKHGTFERVLKGCEGAGLVEHKIGKPRFGPGFSSGTTMPLPGKASRFRATEKLLGMAREIGITDETATDHFFPELPEHPLRLHAHKTGVGLGKKRGPPMEIERTPRVEQMEADILELNAFLDRLEFTGGSHHGYFRIFNLGNDDAFDWNKGGRLYSQGENTYQQLPEEQRLRMQIDGKRVAEVDIKASFLTIFHAMRGAPLDLTTDPYERSGIARPIAKQWTVACFGNSKLPTRWPREMIEDYREETGKTLGEVENVNTVTKAMVAAFPTLKHVSEHDNVWADLQYLEAEAVLTTMLILMRRHGIPSLAMHDGLIVPFDSKEIGARTLKQEYLRRVGVEPQLTVDWDRRFEF